MPKSPYEIRLEVLQMAKDLSIYEFDVSKENLVQNWNAQVDYATKTGTAPPPFPTIMAVPTDASIIERARVLNEFVVTK